MTGISSISSGVPAWLRELVSTLPTPALVVDGGGSILHANEPARRIAPDDARTVDALPTGSVERVVAAFDRLQLVYLRPLSARASEPGPTDGDGRDREADRLAFLAEASAVLASSLEAEPALGALARLVVPRIADLCVIRLRGPDGSAPIVATAHKDPTKRDTIMKAIHAIIREDEEHEVSRVLRTGETAFVPMLDDAYIRGYTTDESARDALRAAKLSSGAIVALSARGQVLGSIALFTMGSSRRLHPSDVELVEELARHAGLAVDNARLYAQVTADRQRLADIISSVPGVVWEAWTGPDRELHLGFVSEHVEDLLGYGVDEWLSEPNLLWTVIHPDDRERVRHELSSPSDRRTQRAIRCRMVARDGRVVGTETFSTIVRDDDGRIVGLRGVTLDIGHRLEAEAALAKAKEAAEAASRAKDYFVSLVSHELRTPLTPVLAAVQTMAAQESLPEDFRVACGVVERNVRREARLIDDLLSLTRMISGELELRLAPVDAHATIDATLEAVRSEASSKGISLETQYGATSYYIQADETRIKRVLWHLLQNAVKFTPSGGRVTVRTSNDEAGELSIAVQDTGVGIAPAVMPRIFQAFEQGAESLGRSAGGLGLGLTLASGVVQLHGGSIDAESGPGGRGAVFRVHIPLAATQPIPVRPAATIAPDVTATGTPRVLLVEDHDDTAILMQLALRRRGYDVQVASTLAEGLRAATTRDFDVLVSDIALPDGSGLDLVRRIRSQRDVPAVALSGFGTEKDVARSRDAGFSEHLIKPVDIRRLVEVLDKLVGRAEQQPAA